MFNLIIILILSFYSLLSIGQTDVNKDSEIKKSKFEFLSQNCTDYGAKSFKCNDLTGFGYLYIPSGQWEKLVIISHGSPGINQRMYDYADELNRNSIATLIIDHWSPRGIKETHSDFVGNRNKGASAGSIAADAIWAIEALKTSYPNIKSFGFMGESQGGVAATLLTKSWFYTIFSGEQYTNKLGRKFSEAPFKAIVGLYAGCFEQVVGEKFVKTPLLLISGELDDNTPAKLCENYVQWINTHSGNATITVLPKEHHDFDATFQVQYFPRAQNPSKCFKIIDGYQITYPILGKTYLNNADGINKGMADCLSWGVTGGNSGNRFIAVPIWMKFFNDHLQISS